MENFFMKPGPGERILRFVGDRVRFTLGSSASGKPGIAPPPAAAPNSHTQAFLRTSLPADGWRKIRDGARLAWRDIPMTWEGFGWAVEFALPDAGYFEAKPYWVDARGWQHWPEGPNAGISVHPPQYRTCNTIYCAFTRMFGPSLRSRTTANPELEERLKALDNEGYTVIPPSGRLRDVTKMLPHFVNTLGCRILHLLPVNPTPATFARFGRFGSPYAACDLRAVDPALVEFDRRTTGIEQFIELTRGAHRLGARVFLDLVTNHTGWGSDLFEQHPGWFLRHPDGQFVSPGAWGITWEDLVELDARHQPLWNYLAETFLIWCRRGVDGFRCDAAYKVPIAVWQTIVRRVRQEYPDTLFLVEGLGGPWHETESLLTEGGTQWAYSELFQEYSGGQIAAYLDHALRQNRRVGLLVNYSETHDNERLANRGRAWSLLRNRLAALTSVSGGFGFACGVEWLAAERIHVHSSRGLGFGSEPHLVNELSQLNRLLAEHPCFFDGAALTRVSSAGSPIYALRRVAAEQRDEILVLINTDLERPHAIQLSPEAESAPSPQFLRGKPLYEWVDLLGQPLPPVDIHADGTALCRLDPAAAYCLAPSATPSALAGEAYRGSRARAAWGLRALGMRFAPEEIGPHAWFELARLVDTDPSEFLGAISRITTEQARTELLPSLRQTIIQTAYLPVIEWSAADRNRITLVPPGHWVLLRDSAPFRAHIQLPGSPPDLNLESIPADGGHLAAFRHDGIHGDAQAEIYRGIEPDLEVKAVFRCLAGQPQWPPAETSGWLPATGRVLLTNGRGAMARLEVDLGAIRSKYDCLLGANLHPNTPVDRHVLAKRIRVWAEVNRFLTPLNASSLMAFAPGPPARWQFSAQAGGGRRIPLALSIWMIDGQNTVVVDFNRPQTANAASSSDLVKLTIRVDIEDRGFHSETRRSAAAEHHFTTHTVRMPDQPGFVFAPAADRQLRVFTTAGEYHSAPEWMEYIPHPLEQERGQSAHGDAFTPGWFEVELAAEGMSPLVVVTAERDAVLEKLESGILGQLDESLPRQIDAASSRDAFADALKQACGAFLTSRGTGRTVIAGYPWFLDWGRDTMIAARGLIGAGYHHEVRELIRTFGRFEQSGTLPNSIHGEDASNRDTTDAPLWFGVVCEDLAAAASGGEPVHQVRVDNGAANRTIGDVLQSIASNYIRGTANGIRMDPATGLVWSPSHFTWMDTNYPAGTPREGYPVEIQALWIRLLLQLDRLGIKATGEPWLELARRAEDSLQRLYWMEDVGWFADQLIASPGQGAEQAVRDNSLRCNGLFLVSLGLVQGARAQRMVQAAARFLVVPGALRSLAPLPVSPPLVIRSAQGYPLNDASHPYWGQYLGDEDTRRKPAYHNGTAWLWTFPAFCEALVLAWDRQPSVLAAARAYLGSMDVLLREGCIGQLPEILDGDAPHSQRGCDAQAWSVTEALRVWLWLRQE